jgi:predicted RNase H-like nuclease (RuvC/YqgF family)
MQKAALIREQQGSSVPSSILLGEPIKLGIERIVKIIKVIEKNKLNRMLDLLENKSVSVSGITEDQVQEVVNMNQKLTGDLEQLKKEKINLIQQNRSLKMEAEKRPSTSYSNINTDELLMLIGGLDEMATGGVGRDIYIRKEAIFDLANRMKRCFENT